MRPIWKGSLSFGLVNVPVRLYSATAGTELSFDMLDKETLSPIHYVRVRKSDGKEVAYEDIVKGYEYEKGDYVVLTDADFETADVKKTHSINVVDFVKADEIDDIYFDKPYYLEPEKGAEKPYVLLREALERSGKVGIAKFVLQSKEHLAALKPSGKALILDQMRYKDDIRPKDELSLPDTEVSKKEVDMALALIDQLSGPFKPEQFHDTYKEDLEKIIETKAKGKPVKVGRSAPPADTEVKDLMVMLKASLEKHKEREKAKARG